MILDIVHVYILAKYMTLCHRFTLVSVQVRHRRSIVDLYASSPMFL